MNCILHIHITTQERDLLFLCVRESEEPEQIFVTSMLCDGKPLGEEGIYHYLKYYQTTIYSEMARKLHVRRNALSILPLSFKDVIA
jgi:hypothetical protein